jgi:hypothetical protein
MRRPLLAGEKGNAILRRSRVLPHFQRRQDEARRLREGAGLPLGDRSDSTRQIASTGFLESDHELGWRQTASGKRGELGTSDLRQWTSSPATGIVFVMPRRLVNFALALTIGGAIALGVAVFIVVPPLMVGSSTFTGQEGVSPAGAKEKLLKARSDIRTSGIALLTFFGVVAGAVLTFRTVRATRAGQAADRLTDAVKALGDNSQASQMSALMH